MKCDHCGSEWTTTTESKKAICPFCGKQLENIASSQPATRGRFQLSYDKTTLVQFLGDEKNVVIPAGITRIGAGAFRGYGVETVYIPDGVTEIGDNCFNGCKQLREVRIPASVTHISDSAFRDTGKKKIIAEKGSYAWNKYAKPAAEDKPVAPIAPVEPKPINKTVSAPSVKPAESDGQAGTPMSKAPVTEQPAGNTPSAKELCEQQVDEFLTLQHKKARWAKLLGCKPGDKPWIIKGSLFVSADKRVKNLKARIKNIHDQELLARIVAETNNGRVRLAAVKNITNQSIVEKLAYDKSCDVRLAAVKMLKSSAVLEHVAISDTSSAVRIAAISRVKSQPVLQIIAEKDEDDEVCKAALTRITNQGIVEQIAVRSHDWHKRLIAVNFVKDAVVLNKIAQTDKNADVRKAAEAVLRASPNLSAASLFKNIQCDLRLNKTLPTKITLHTDNIQFFLDGELVKNIAYSKYGIGNLPLYNSWWATDMSEGGIKQNPLHALADLINAHYQDRYAIDDKIIHSESRITSEIVMHCYNQAYIDMHLKH